MPCYKPIQAYQGESGEVFFQERSHFRITRSLQLPCGQCIGCRLERSRQWAVRCLHEASLHERNCFVTLTYSDEHLPRRGMLDYEAFQKFMKRLRKHAAPTRPRFYMCGEYGPENGRPHYHACLFNWDFADRTYWRKSPSGEKLYRSEILEKLWPFGNCEIGNVTFESAAYVARYCVQKVTGFNAKYHYHRVDQDGPYQLPPEFNKMSLKPGIGASWLEKYQDDVYPDDFVVIKGKEAKPPKYYDKLLTRWQPEIAEEIAFKREQDARAKYEDNTDARLAVKEKVAQARSQLLHRNQIK